MLDQLPPDGFTVLVVESEAGEILGCWGFGAVYHLEGLYVAPSERNRGRVIRRLLHAMRAQLVGLGVSAVMTTSVSDLVTDIIVRQGGQARPGTSFVVPVQRSS